MFDFPKAQASLTSFPSSPKRLLAFDTETTGLALRRESAPFMLCLLYDNGESFTYEADYDPLTRQCFWSKEDQVSIAAHFEDENTLLIASNAKFDVLALTRIFECDPVELLCRTHDTILQHHRLNNQERHGLKSAAVKYASIIDSDESDLKQAVTEARKIAIKLRWKVASKEACPSVTKAPTSGWAVMDYALPAAVAKYQKRPPSDPWYTLCAKYCSTDCLRSLLLYQAFAEALEADSGTVHYLENRCSLPISFLAESRGITLNIQTSLSLIKTFEVDQANSLFAVQYALGARSPINPNSTKSIRYYFYDFFGLPVTHWTKPAKESSSPQPSTDADFIADIANKYKPEDMELLTAPKWDKSVESYKDFCRRIMRWSNMLAESQSNQLFAFCCALLTYKSCTTAITYLKGYLQAAQSCPNFPGYGLLNPSFNSVGTKGLRYSSSNPNLQNVSRGGKTKKGTEWLKRSDRSLRSVFGPLPGREWWSVDYSQIQPVIFAMCCGDPDFASAMRQGKDPYKFLAHHIYNVPVDQDVEKFQRDTAKTVLLAFLFGAGEKKLQSASGISNVYALLAERMPIVVKFLTSMEWQVRNNGYIIGIDGYKLFIPEDKPHSAVNYLCQSGEGAIVKRAQIGIQAYLDTTLSSPLDMYQTLWVHDEVVFDCRAGVGRQHIGSIIRIMMDAALSFGIPCRVSPKFMDDNHNWSNGLEMKALL
ncbi:3'-5' exonuclease domain containing protein [uncultured Caudovirales phage]|uniref:3'-5' exonuclease domain containing protein n=1 Tax=uncultured Caudovirales phage TaxID=2100421 RepID=A0A6J7XMN1_9CAUD|nr:3'-5' exonuclease domain containing protein [uncultured Caudovirales phage]CAB4182515.1 3'-5' exonuclease domain containing protein [uncultured Caudovirales phage]CAB4198212.1 3'-5' exonuclease domain containing protein [uncultured Caudovirales phage]CAB4211292.1 3'-5' exonuclease domain containing protein [uncultured Caudovirales phage]CAB5237991.1 3'-5' exonuclease domain containing protein [uncultured Caudovirales phage]